MGETRDVELAASLGMDGLALRKREAAASHGNRLRLQGHDVHLDCGLALVPPGFVGERIESKIAPEFAIDADQKVEIEFRGHALLVIVSRDQGRDVLAQVDADDRLAALSHMLTHPAKESAGVRGQEIAERAPRKKRGPRTGGNVRWNVKVGGEI